MLKIISGIQVSPQNQTEWWQKAKLNQINKINLVLKEHKVLCSPFIKNNKYTNKEVRNGKIKR